MITEVHGLIIDPEFHEQIPPLSDEEYAQLEENIVRDGCRDPLVVWQPTPNDLVVCGSCQHTYPESDETCSNCHESLSGGQSPNDRCSAVLLDGHNRYAICQKHGIEYRTVSVDLLDREAAADWIDQNQLGRRNLSPDQMSLLRGRRYNRAKMGHGGDRRSRAQNGPLIGKTYNTLAAQHGVSRNTIKRDGTFAAAVDKLKSIDPDIEKRVAKGDAPPKSTIEKAARLLETCPEKAQAALRGEIKLADVVRDEKRADIKQRLESIEAMAVKEANGVYDVIVIDPPWPMQKIEREVRPNQSEFDYPVMQEDELAGMKIPAADDCHMWLWTTHKFLPMAMRLLDAWSFKYVCTFVWHKPGGFQPIGLPQYNCEFAIYARRGSPQFVDTKAFNTCFDAPRGKHSEKPDEFYDVVRRVTAGRRIDMFNRRPIDGFDSWGNEAQ